MLNSLPHIDNADLGNKQEFGSTYLR